MCISQAKAEETSDFQVLQIEHFSIETWKNINKTEPYQPDLTGAWTVGGAFNFDLRFMEVFKWENKIHLDGARKKVMHAGWEFTLSLDTWYQVQPFFYHHSEHSADRFGATREYPLIDRIGIRFCALGCGKD